MAACEKVLGTYELLENIVVHMDAVMIQTAKKVSEASNTFGTYYSSSAMCSIRKSMTLRAA